MEICWPKRKVLEKWSRNSKVLDVHAPTKGTAPEPLLLQSCARWSLVCSIRPKPPVAVAWITKGRGESELGFLRFPVLFQAQVSVTVWSRSTTNTWRALRQACRCVPHKRNCSTGPRLWAQSLSCIARCHKGPGRERGPAAQFKHFPLLLTVWAIQ
jgi:hypothetical protein